MIRPKIKASIRKRVTTTLAAELAALRGLAKATNEPFYRAVELLMSRSGKIVVTGLGKSAFAGMKIAATATSLGQPAVFMHALEAMHGDSGIVFDGDVVIGISFSGNTAEVIKTIRHLKDTRAIKVLAITGNKKGALWGLADGGVLLSVTKEGDPLGHAPMASVTASIVAGDMLVSAIVSAETFEEKHFARLHPSGSLGLALRKVSEIMISRANVPLAEAADNLGNVLKTMSAKKLGIIGITDARGKLAGIISDGDVRRFLEKHESRAGFVAKDIMTRNPKQIRETDSLKDALRLMELHKITSLFVVKGKGIPTGIIRLQQIVEEGLK